MKHLFILILLIISISFSVHSQKPGTKYRKINYPEKSLQAGPNQEQTLKSTLNKSENPSSIYHKMNNQKPARIVSKKYKNVSSDEQQKDSTKNSNINKKEFTRQSTSIVAENAQLLYPNTLRITPNVTPLSKDFNTGPVSDWNISGGISTATADSNWHQEEGMNVKQWEIDNEEAYQGTSTTIAGETCSNSIVLTGAFPMAGSGTGISNFSSDYSSILTTPYGYSGPDMVYAYTATFSGTLDLTFNCDYDNVIAVFISCTNPASSQIASADANVTFPYSESISISVISGTTYYIVNAAYGATAFGNWSYTIESSVGEDCTTPIFLTSTLPITGSGTGIETFSDDYSLTIPTPWGYDGGDVVYEITPTVSGDITITFNCDFDNVIAVFSNCNSPVLSLVDTVDNNYSPPYSENLTFPAVSGATYFILIAAYDALAAGDWEFTIDFFTPCVDNLIPYGTPEIEPNGGLSKVPVEYDPRSVGSPLVPATITGNYFTIGDSMRDMDWFNFTLTQEMIITATVDVDCTNPVLFIISDNTIIDPNSGTTIPEYAFMADINGSGIGETLTTSLLPIGDYWFVVAPAVFTGIPLPVNYNATLSGEGTGATQYLYFEDFEDGIPTDITLYDLDGLIPNISVSSFTQAWNSMVNPDDASDTIAASNSWYTPPGQANDWLVTPGISIGNDAFLAWDIKAFHPTWPDGYQVRISTTGASTSSFTTTIYSVAAASPIWETNTINLSSLGFSNTTIWIAFINNSNDLYHLLLDDIAVYATNPNDVLIQDAHFTPLSGFSIIPLDQAGFTFGATALNGGTAPLSNIVFNVDVLGNSYSESATVGTLAPGDSAAATISIPFIPTTMDTYNVYYTMTATGDGVFSNNEALFSIEISDTVLARDNGNPSAGVGFAGNTGHLGNVFEIVTLTTLSSVSAYFTAATTGEAFSFTLFSNYNYLTNTVGLPIFTSSVFTKTTSMAGSWNTFEVPTTSLMAGNYLLVINQLDTTNISLGYDNNPNGFLVFYTSTPDSLTASNWLGNSCIRMNFGASSPAPSWTYSITSENHSILIPTNIPISIDGVPVGPGDYIGLFYHQGGVEACGGYTQYTANVNYITAWGAQAGLNDGFQPGEAFKWKIWDASTGIEYKAAATYNTLNYPDGGNYVTNGMSGLFSLVATTSQTHSVNLASGWNIFSTYIEPFEPSLDSVFNPILSQVEIVKSGDGLIFWPQYGINFVGNLTIGQGYYVKCPTAQVLDIVGLEVDPLNTGIPLPQGWSIMAYLHQTPANVDSMMAAIVSNVTIIKSGFGLVYWPVFNLNAIGNLLPGQGYQIRLINADNFCYPAITSSPTKSNPESKAVHFKNNINTGNNMSICFPASAWDKKLNVGDEIAAFNRQNRMIGSAVVAGTNIAITVWGQDNLESSGDGISDGEEISFRLWKNENDEEYKLLVEDWIEGNNVYQKNGVSVAGLVEIVEQDLLFQNHPNPFANNTEISFCVAEEGMVQLELYSVLGYKLGLIYSAYTPAGKHSVIFNSSELSSGTYFYRMISQELTTTRSMSVQK